MKVMIFVAYENQHRFRLGSFKTNLSFAVEVGPCILESQSAPCLAEVLDNNVAGGVTIRDSLSTRL